MLTFLGFGAALILAWLALSVLVPRLFRDILNVRGPVALAVAFLGLALAGCTRPTDTGTGPGNYIPISCVGQNVCNSGASGGDGTGSAGTGSANLPPGSIVSVGVFGRSCPSGIQDVPAGQRQFKVGCTYDITATPRDASQKEIPIEVSGPSASWQEPFPAGLGQVFVDSNNTYNAQFLAGPGAGSVELCAAVKGTKGCGTYAVVR